MILILSHNKDLHTQVVLKELERMQAEAIILDLAEFPQRMNLQIKFSGSKKPSYRIIFSDGRHLDLRSCGAVWWRRPQSYQMHDEIEAPNHRAFAYNESEEAFKGLWYSQEAYWINPPERDALAHRKVFQLRIAQEVGLRTPETCITNDPDSVRGFIKENGYDQTIYKAFSATRTDWRETRILREDELTLLNSVKYAPVIFQEYIKAKVDLRITIVGDKVFPAAIYSQDTSYKVDFRMDMERARIEEHKLPSNITQMLLTFMKRLGLVYGAIDMRLTPEGDYVFLEINPAGQWYFIEKCTGQPISQTIAHLLAMHGGKRTSSV